VNHFTDKPGYNGIGSQVTWHFVASRPPGNHPKGAYFTTLNSSEPNLAEKLRISREKIAFVFQFQDAGDLQSLRGGRGRYIFYSEEDYEVEQERQQFKGATGL